MYIETERLIIERFAENDWRDAFVYTSRVDVMEYIPEGVFTEEDAKDFVMKNAGEDAKHFPVRIKGEETIIGHITFFKYFGDHTYEIGWVFNPDYFNKGYATEAARAVVGFGFAKMKLHRIIATCQPENIPSWRVMEKIGMRREGCFKKCIPNGDSWWDEYYYAVLDEEWNK